MYSTVSDNWNNNFSSKEITKLKKSEKKKKKKSGAASVPLTQTLFKR